MDRVQEIILQLDDIINMGKCNELETFILNNEDCIKEIRAYIKLNRKITKDIDSVIKYIDDDICTDEFLLEFMSLNLSGKKNINISLDSDGDILIHKQEKCDFMQIYTSSHRLLKTYHKNKDYEGIKYELSKLWFLLNILEYKILFNKSKLRDVFQTKELKEKATIARAHILSDINIYMTIIIKEHDSEFNFHKYYESSPFFTETFKINKELATLILKSMTKI